MTGQSATHTPTRHYTAIVLAGRRSGPDTLAAAAGGPHRALLDINGVPMLERVVGTLSRLRCIAQVLVSTDAPDLVERIPLIRRMIRDGRLLVMGGRQSPSRRVLQVLDHVPCATPLLVTTADHALLTPAMVEWFLADAQRSGADVSLGLVAASRVRARFPQSKRTYIPFRDDGYSGANLFAFMRARGRRAAEFWTRVEESRKRPWRLARAFGLGALLSFWFRRWDLEAAMRRVSWAVGASIHAVPLPFAEAAVDVDRMSDLLLVRQLLRSERETDHPSRVPAPLDHAFQHP